jgi:hypothetical protein
MKLEVRGTCYCESYIHSVESFKLDKVSSIYDSYFYLRKDGTIHTSLRGGEDWFKNKQEAQQFLDAWMPQKKRLSKSHVEWAARSSELEALDCSIEHWKQNLLDVDNAILGSPHCAICMRANNRIRDIHDRCCNHCILNDYENLPVNCCEEYKAFADSYSGRTEENAIAMLNKLIIIRNKEYGNPYEKAEVKKMANIEFDDGVKVELSKETTERLRKELVKPKPYQFKAGDVIENRDGHKRIIAGYSNELKSFNLGGLPRSIGQYDFELWGYKKIGVIKDFIK